MHTLFRLCLSPPSAIKGPNLAHQIGWSEYPVFAVRLQPKSVNRVALSSRISRSLLSAQMASSPLTANASHSSTSTLTSSLILIRTVISARAFFKSGGSTSVCFETWRKTLSSQTCDIKQYEMVTCLDFWWRLYDDGLEQYIQASLQPACVFL